MGVEAHPKTCPAHQYATGRRPYEASASYASWTHVRQISTGSRGTAVGRFLPSVLPPPSALSALAGTGGKPKDLCSRQREGKIMDLDFSGPNYFLPIRRHSHLPFLASCGISPTCSSNLFAKPLALLVESLATCLQSHWHCHWNRYRQFSLQAVIIFLRCVPTANWNRSPWKNHTSCNHHPYMVVVAIGFGTLHLVSHHSPCPHLVRIFSSDLQALQL